MYPIRWTLEKGHLIGSFFVYNEKTTIGADQYEHTFIHKKTTGTIKTESSCKKT